MPNNAKDCRLDPRLEWLYRDTTSEEDEDPALTSEPDVTPEMKILQKWENLVDKVWCKSRALVHRVKAYAISRGVSRAGGAIAYCREMALASSQASD